MKKIRMLFKNVYKNKKPSQLVSFAAIALLLLIIIGQSYWLVFADQSPSPETAASLSAYANQVVAACATAPYRAGCYEERVTKLLDRISMEDAFTVTTMIQGMDRSYGYCHVLGHDLAAKETARDPSKWKDVIARCPSNVCSNGCIHGAFLERFRKETLSPEELTKHIPEFKSVCEARGNWHPTGMEQATCYHALGHLLMFATEGDIHQSLAMCKIAAVKPDGRDFSHVCIDGSFMQIFQPLDSDALALVTGKEPTKETLKPYCDTFSGDERSSCWSEAWPLSREELQQPGKVAEYCSYLHDMPDEEKRCISAMVFVITPQFNFDASKLTAFCDGMPKVFRPICYSNVASRMLENDNSGIPKAVDFCAASAKNDPAGACYNELVIYSTFNYHPGSPQSQQLCSLLPDVWKRRCMAGGQTVR